MREFGGKAMMSLLMMRLSASVAQDTGTCQRVLVEIADTVAESETHSGRFYPVGTETDFTTLYRSEGDYLLQYVDEGEEYDTFEPPLSELDLVKEEPTDEDLEEQDLEELAPRVDRHRLLQECGYWVIGMRGAGDVAMYPMIKVLDCAGDPTNIDGDSEWFRQECFECAEEQGIGDVTVTLEDYPCGSYTFPPTPAPTVGDTPSPVEAKDDTPSPDVDDSPDTPVFPLPTPAPTDASDDGDKNEDEVIIDPAGSGASKLGGRLGAAAVAVLGVAASVIVNTIQS